MACTKKCPDRTGDDCECLAAPLPEIPKPAKNAVSALLCGGCGLFYCKCPAPVVVIGSAAHEAPPPHNGTPTSRAAADSIVPHRKTMKDRVSDFIGSCGFRGATDEEIQEGTGMNPSTERPRRQELEKDKVIKSAGTRWTKSGREAKVWIRV